MQVAKLKHFANGSVYALKTDDGFPVEVTDTFLPFYTKDAIGRKQNYLDSSDLGSRSDRWMVGVSTMSGCPIRCKFCATGQLKKCRYLTAGEIVDQVKFILDQNPTQVPYNSSEFKINYTRMGEPFLNIEEVRKAIEEISQYIPNAHHYISTIGIKGSDFSWIEGNVSLQVSLHSLDESRRRDLIPYGDLMGLSELGQIRTKSKLKTTLNLTLCEKEDWNGQLLKEFFDPEFFFVKLSPINRNVISDKNGLGGGVIEAHNLK